MGNITKTDITNPQQRSQSPRLDSTRGKWDMTSFFLTWPIQAKENTEPTAESSDLVATGTRHSGEWLLPSEGLRYLHEHNQLLQAFLHASCTVCPGWAEVNRVKTVKEVTWGITWSPRQWPGLADSLSMSLTYMSHGVRPAFSVSIPPRFKGNNMFLLFKASVSRL